MAKKILLFTLLAAIIAVVAFIAFADNDKVLHGEAEGYGGLVKVQVTIRDEVITKVEVDAPHETPGVGTKAVEILPQKIVEQGHANIDVLSGATITSNAILDAVNKALGIKTSEKQEGNQTGLTENEASLFLGMGIFNTGRIGPMKDEKGNNVYSVNQAVASVLFDKEDRIKHIFIDQVEFFSPNMKDTQRVFSLYQNGEVDVSNVLTTKRALGKDYALQTGTWKEQMDAYQRMFLGKKYDEIIEFTDKLFSNIDYKPLSPSSKNKEDVDKYNALSEAEKETLSDLTSKATISLNDVHGNILGAIKKAFDNKIPVDQGANSFSFVFTPYLTSQDQDKVLDEIFAVVFFDENNKITCSYFDQLQLTTNFGSKTSSFLSKYPYQNEDDITLNEKDKEFLSNIQAFKTKRELKDQYKMPAGTWAEQMDAYQQFFNQKTVDEIKKWVDTYCSSMTGKPLKPDVSDEKDKEKYNALTEEEKQSLSDVVSSASMSLKSPANNFIEILEKAYQTKMPLNETDQNTVLEDNKTIQPEGTQTEETPSEDTEKMPLPTQLKDEDATTK